MHTKSPILLAAILASGLCAAGTAAAQEQPGQIGVGAYIGTPFGFSAKYLIDRRNAVDAAFGVQDGDLDMHLDFLTHFRDMSHQPPQGRLAPYLGLGLKVKDEPDALFGIRFLGGLSYAFPKAPLEAFAEIAPVLRMAPSLGSGVDGGVGLRYYFGPAKPR
ncbi:MAG: hypothetical protein HY926_12755 [Elusimicrobia bacterium]|nr:hypothetical protein [Elusimicrobiota bacterium]